MMLANSHRQDFQIDRPKDGIRVAISAEVW